MGAFGASSIIPSFYLKFGLNTIIAIFLNLFLYDLYRRRKCETWATATILDIKEKSKRNGWTIFAVAFEFIDNSANKHQKTIDYGVNRSLFSSKTKPRFSVGDVIKIIYDSKAPETARIESPAALYIVASFILIMDFAFIWFWHSAILGTIL